MKPILPKPSKAFYTCFVLILLATSIEIQAQIEITGQNTPEELVSALLNQGIEVSNIELNCPNTSYGIFEAQSDVGIGMSQGIVLSSGSIADIPGPNNVEDISFPSGGGSDQFLDEILAGTGVPSVDACVLEIDLVPCGEILSFNYVFASDEYNEYACSEFNDVFAFLISGPNPDGGDYVNQNIALIPGTNLPVAINSVNNGNPGTGSIVADCVLDNADLFVDNENAIANIEYDGFTVPLTAFAMVVPDETYTLYLAIADASDESWDSGVFIEAGSLSAQFIDLVIEPQIQVPGIDNLVEGCINGVINFETTAPVTEDLIIQYTLAGSAENGVDYGDANGDPLGGIVIIPLGSSNTAIELNVLSDNITEGIEDIIISVMNETDCSGVPLSVSLGIEDEEALAITACCDATIETGDFATLTASGGDGTFTWSPDDGSIDDINSANPTVNPTQTTTYTVVSGIDGCDISSSVTITVGAPVDCVSEAGPVSGGGMICAGDTFSAGGSIVLETDDVGANMLHNSPTGNPADVGFEVYELTLNGSFTNDGSYPYNETLYISTVIGNDDGQGFPDLNDPCLSVSEPAEVILYAPVVVNVQEICDGENGELNVEISITGGANGFNGSGIYTLNGTSLNSVGVEYGLNTLVSLGVFSGSTYTYSASDPSGCQGSFVSDVVECIKTAVELYQFDAIIEGKANRIYWTTETEIDNDYFVLERSFDGESFEAIKIVEGAGNSVTTNSYNYLDYDTRDGNTFYRLKSVEFSGLTSWSYIITLSRSTAENGSFNVYPIPAGNELIVELITGTEVSSEISVVDVSGKYLIRKSVGTQEDQVKLNVSDLVPGLYLLIWQNAHGTEVVRFTKE